MSTGKHYDEEFKKQAILLAKKIGNTAAANELGIPKGTIGTWMKKTRSGEIDTGTGTCTPEGVYESCTAAPSSKQAYKGT